MINLGNDTIICQGASILLDATTPNASYLWNDNSTNPTYNVTQQGTYWVRVDIIGENCGNADSIYVEFKDAPNVDLGNDTIVCENTTLILDATTPAALGYQWHDGSTNPIYNATGPGLYKVMVDTECGIISDSIQLFLPNSEDVFIPNVITPDNDEWNNFFEISGTDHKIRLIVYNRWGKEVYRSNSYNNDWNGQNLSSGNYYYYINIGCINQNYSGWLKIIK